MLVVYILNVAYINPPTWQRVRTYTSIYVSNVYVYICIMQWSTHILIKWQYHTMSTFEWFIRIVDTVYRYVQVPIAG